MDMGFPERRVGHYCDDHQILVVGDGDFSFSCSLAQGFGHATNMVCTSLDDADDLKKKYQNAILNIKKLLDLGCTIKHGVDATKMRWHSDLRMRKFDRIIFNFPHAGFHGNEGDKKIIRKHRKLVGSFFLNAIFLLRPYGEVHVSHKTSEPFNQWNLEDLAVKSGFTLVDCVKFEKTDYPGYNHKRGSGKRSDEPFPLGECRTFKFEIRNFLKAKAPMSARRPEIGIVQDVYHPELLQAGYEFPRPDSLSHRLCETSYEYPRSMFGTSSYSAVGSPRPRDSRSLRHRQLIPSSYLPVSESINHHQLIPNFYWSIGPLRRPESESTNHHQLITSSYLSVGLSSTPESESIKQDQLNIPRYEPQGYFGSRYLRDRGQELGHQDVFRDVDNGCGEQSEWFRDTFHYHNTYHSGYLSGKFHKLLYEAERDLQPQHRYQEFCGRDKRTTELQETLQNWSTGCPGSGFRF